MSRISVKKMEYFYKTWIKQINMSNNIMLKFGKSCFCCDFLFYFDCFWFKFKTFKP